MDDSLQKERRRKDIAGVVAILLGLSIGLLIKRVKVGLLIGLVLGVIAVMLLKRK